MLLEDFRKYLKRKGKKDKVIERNIHTILEFQSFIKNENVTPKEVSIKDIKLYVDKIEKTGRSAKGYLYVLMNYFRYIEDQELLSFATQLREERTRKTRRIFPLKKILCIDLKIIEKLSSIGIKNVEQMLEYGRTKEQRGQLAAYLDIPENKILELVSLSDLTRMGYVKRKLSRLYYNAGLLSPIEVAKFDTETLYELFKDYVENSGWNGMIPNRKDLENNINNARQLKEIVEY